MDRKYRPGIANAKGQDEEKFKLNHWLSSFAIGVGLIFAFSRPWVGIPISLIGFLIFPKVQQFLSEKLKGKYNNWTKGTVIASLLSVSFAANGVYSDALEKKNAEQTKIEKMKADESDRINREKQIRVDSAMYFVQLASKNIKENKYDNAESNLQQAIGLDPENPNAAYYRGVILQNKGKYSKALEEYDKVRTISDLDAGELQCRKGQCYLNIGKKEEALSAFQMSGNLGFAEGSRLYEKYKPKPKKMPQISPQTAPLPSSYSSSGGGRGSGDCLAGQCIAYTKKGNRCSRKTTNCSGRCWQH